MPEQVDPRLLITEARSRNAQLGRKHPSDPLYRMIERHLARVVSLLDVGSLAAYEACGPLAIIAVRELEETEGGPQELANTLYELYEALAVLAGDPD